MPTVRREICPSPAPRKLAIGTKPECCCSSTLWDDRMRLMLQLIARLLVVVGLCLGAAVLWATIDAYRSVDRATAATVQRVSQALQAIYWQQLLLRSNRTREHLLPL